MVEKQPFFFGAGRVWDPAKNFALLQQVAPYLNWPMQVAGMYESETPGTASSGGLQKLGHIASAHLLELMAKASVFVHPALYEPFGLSVLDAARARCCLVLADTPSMRELWAEAAIFLDPRDPRTWIETLNALSGDVARCRELGDRAFSHAGRYTAESSVRAYQGLYAELITRGGKRAEEAA
jgi:glycosyltransferase involved in cell wall biosynthesis